MKTAASSINISPGCTVKRRLVLLVESGVLYSTIGVRYRGSQSRQ